MQQEKQKFVVDIIAVMLAAFSVVISIRGCRISQNAEKTAGSAVQVSRESNQIAGEALETSKYQFLQTNRPHIIISPKRYDDGQFWRVTQRGAAVEVELRYEIKNVGNVAAGNVSLPDKLAVGREMNLEEGAPVTFQKAGKVTLGPGDSFDLAARVAMGYGNADDAKKNHDSLVSDNSEGAFFRLSVDYTNELDQSRRYRTCVMNRIHNCEAQLIKSEMVVVSGDSEKSEEGI